MVVREEGCIIFIDGISRVGLVSSGPTKLGFPIRIEVLSGPFSVVTEAEAWDYGGRDALVRIRETLVGKPNGPLSRAVIP